MKNYVKPEAEVLFGLTDLYCKGVTILNGTTSEVGIDQILVPHDPFGDEE